MTPSGSHLALTAHTERIDGQKKSGAGLSYRHELQKNLALEVGADIWRDITTDYRVYGGLTWRW